MIVSNISAQQFIPIWEKGKMPNSKGLAVKDSVANERFYRVSNPGIHAFFLPKMIIVELQSLFFPVAVILIFLQTLVVLNWQNGSIPLE